MKFRSKKSKRGQNTAEYLIMLVLIAVGSITFVGLFGKTIKKQFKNSMAAMEGESGNLATEAVSTEGEVKSSDMKIEANDFPEQQGN